MCKSRGRVFLVEEAEHVKFLKSENFWFIAGTARELVMLEIWGIKLEVKLRPATLFLRV